MIPLREEFRQKSHNSLILVGKGTRIGLQLFEHRLRHRRDLKGIDLQCPTHRDSLGIQRVCHARPVVERLEDHPIRSS